MISLKRLINGRGEEMLEAYRRITVLLLESIAIHAVEGETLECEGFRNTIVGLANSISEKTQPSEVFIAAGTASKAMQEYGCRTTRFIKAQSIELQAIIGMLTRTMSELSTGSDRSIGRLQEIEQKLAKTAMIDDLRTLKLRMSECLDAVREECIQQKHASMQVVGDLRSGMASAEAQKFVALEQQDDPVTGLPIRAHAEAELKNAADSGKRLYAGIFVVDRMQAINSRFGRAIGDNVLLFFVQKLTEVLSAADKMFKWGDSSFVATIDRQESLENVRRELSHHLHQKWERHFELGKRSVVLPISATWLLIEASGRPAPKAIAEIDSFVAKTVPM